LEILVTGPMAAELFVPLMPADRLDLYAFPPMRSSWFAEQAMRWVPSETAPNVYLWIASNSNPRVGKIWVDDVPIVGRAQLILDLHRVGGRSLQVAEELRQRWDL